MECYENWSKIEKGLSTILSVVVIKTIQLKINERLAELQKEVAQKGFRPGKVPPSVIKVNLENQFMERLLIKF